jgi:hypothetical protein
MLDGVEPGDVEWLREQFENARFYHVLDAEERARVARILAALEKGSARATRGSRTHRTGSTLSHAKPT